MSKAHRLFARRRAQNKSVPGTAANRRTEPIAVALAEDLGQGPEAAARNAQSIAEVLKRAVRRRKANAPGRGKPPT